MQIPNTTLKNVRALMLAAAIIGVTVSIWMPAQIETESVTGPPSVDVFIDLLGRERGVQLKALRRIENDWYPGSAVMLLEVTRLWKGGGPSGLIFATLSRQTGQTFARDSDAWFRWVWQQKFEPHPEYAAFKSRAYALIDRRFAEYFSTDRVSAVGLDEIRWGGVRRDGIPPLDHPKMITAEEADWLDDDNVVFGVEVNGHARCYPRRILAWHEMVKDTVGGREINGVYCTLCGSMILYDPVFAGVHHKLGTSGFLYRSNKLMYDEETKSMWSTLTGRPVVGPLAGTTIQLERLFVVTTTWKGWRARHPDTDVLSLETGHRRDYGEGVAYRKYFATDELMFTVPLLDRRLQNKQPVLAMREDGEPARQVAIDTAFLKENRVYHDSLNSRNFVVLTDSAGGNRSYWTDDIVFTELLSQDQVQDSRGVGWAILEDRLEGPEGRTLPRAAAHEAFWFAWASQFPDTRLVSHPSRK